MNTIAEYVTVQKPSLLELDQEVNRLINDAYQPYGNPYVVEKLAGISNPFCICQAMVKDSSMKTT